MQVKHSIKLKPEVEPYVGAPRSVPLAIKPKLKAELDRLEQLGVIQNVRSQLHG